MLLRLSAAVNYVGKIHNFTINKLSPFAFNKLTLALTLLYCFDLLYHLLIKKWMCSEIIQEINVPPVMRTVLM